MPGIRRKAVDFFDKSVQKDASNKKSRIEANDLILGEGDSENDSELSDDEIVKPGLGDEDLSGDSDDNGDHQEEEDEGEEKQDNSRKAATPTQPTNSEDAISLQNVNDLGNDKELEDIVSGRTSAHKIKPISKKKLERDLKKIEKSGVVYLSRVPPFMKPAKVRSIMSRFGEINRVFLAPEDPKSRLRRIKSGGNKKTMYTEGWIEFVKKKQAKLAADTLNGNIVGGKKGSYYHDDILSVKYLHKFKWHNLTEQIALEAQSRHEKLKAEIAQATAQNKAFIEGVEKKRMQDKRGQTSDAIKRTFDQRDVTSKRAGESKQKPAANLTNVLGKIF